MHLETEPTVPGPDSSTLPQHAHGLLFVLSAPSGTGKDTVINALAKRGINFHVVASVTTRAPRSGESEGNPYHFLSKEAFEEMIAQGELLEYANVHGNWYGQPIQSIRDNLRKRKDVLLKIDVQGAATVREKLQGAIFIFLVPGSIEELVQRLLCVAVRSFEVRVVAAEHHVLETHRRQCRRSRLVVLEARVDLPVEVLLR